MLSISASVKGTRRKRSKAMSSWPWPCSARPIMRLVSADSSSDLSLPASVIRKRLVVSARWPMTRSAAGKTNLSQVAAADSRLNSTTSSTTNSSRVTMAALPADSRGSPAIR